MLEYLNNVYTTNRSTDIVYMVHIYKLDKYYTYLQVVFDFHHKHSISNIHRVQPEFPKSFQIKIPTYSHNMNDLLKGI